MTPDTLWIVDYFDADGNDDWLAYERKESAVEAVSDLLRRGCIVSGVRRFEAETQQSEGTTQ